MKKLLVLALLPVVGTMCPMEEGAIGQKRKWEESNVLTLQQLAGRKIAQIDDGSLSSEQISSPKGGFEFSLKRHKTPFAYITYNQDETIGEIEHVFVDKKYRRRGLGTHLVKFACKKLEEMECEQIALQVKKENIKARKLYKKLGFKKNEEDSTESLYTYVKEC